jgi:hypothetical protein
LTIQIESAAEMPSCCPMVGRATLATVPSITESDTPKATARMAPSRWGMGSPSAGRWGMWGAACIATAKVGIFPGFSGKRPGNSGPSSHNCHMGFSVAAAGKRAVFRVGPGLNFLF